MVIISITSLLKFIYTWGIYTTERSIRVFNKMIVLLGYIDPFIGHANLAGENAQVTYCVKILPA